MGSLQVSRQAVPKLLRERGWTCSHGLWRTEKRGLKRHTARGILLAEAASIECISFFCGEDRKMEPHGMKARMLEQARLRTPETTDGLQVDLWRLVEAEAEVPVWKVKALLHYVADLEGVLTKVSGDPDGGPRPKLRLK